MSATAPAGDGESWIDRRMPAGLRPYLKLARLDRPIGTWLLLFPCWWSMTLAAPGLPSPWMGALFAIGACAMRGAGCTVNDIVDRDFDARVARTRTRPIASGRIGVSRALIFLGVQLAIGLAVLVQFQTFAIWVCIASLPMVAAYPFMKRITWWPQAWLGLTFNWGAMAGWAAVTGALDPPAGVLYLAGLFWTLGYDTIYAHQDKEDDALIGVRSSARRLGRATRAAVAAFYAAFLALATVAGALADVGPLFYPALIALAAQLAWQVLTLETDRPGNCLDRFNSNRWPGWLFLAALLLGKVDMT